MVDDPQQKKIATKTRDLVTAQVGSYQHLNSYVKNPDGAPDDNTLLRARNMATLPITLQDVRGEVAKAERSFLKINQSATLIDPTELTMIQARRKPNAIATRALIHAGEGHPYWGSFPEAAQTRVKALAHETYDDLFRPILEYPIRTMQLPAAGLSLTPDSLDLVFNLVNFLNRAVDSSTKRLPGQWKFPTPDGVGQRDLDDDADGALTIKFIQEVRDATRRVFGPGRGSLSLHPGVYCYGATGRFLPTAFFGAIAFVKDLELHRKFAYFTERRARFEDFIISHRLYINQIAGSYGAQLRGMPSTKRMYDIILNNVDSNDDKIIEGKIIDQTEFSFIRNITEDDRKYGRNFSVDSKNMIYLREALAKELTCAICHARIRAKTITLDHKDRKEDGGLGTPDNGQLAHPYCNDGYKEKLARAARLEA